MGLTFPQSSSFWGWTRVAVDFARVQTTKISVHGSINMLGLGQAGQGADSSGLRKN